MSEEEGGWEMIFPLLHTPAPRWRYWAARLCGKKVVGFDVSEGYRVCAIIYYWRGTWYLWKECP